MINNKLINDFTSTSLNTVQLNKNSNKLTVDQLNDLKLSLDIKENEQFEYKPVNISQFTTNHTKLINEIHLSDNKDDDLSYNSNNIENLELENEINIENESTKNISIRQLNSSSLGEGLTDLRSYFPLLEGNEENYITQTSNLSNIYNMKNLPLLSTKMNNIHSRENKVLPIILIEQVALINKTSTLLEKLTGQKILMQVKNHIDARTIKLDIELTKQDILDTISQVYWTKTRSNKQLITVINTVLKDYMLNEELQKGQYKFSWQSEEHGSSVSVVNSTPDANFNNYINLQLHNFQYLWYSMTSWLIAQQNNSLLSIQKKRVDQKLKQFVKDYNFITMDLNSKNNKTKVDLTSLTKKFRTQSSYIQKNKTFQGNISQKSVWEPSIYNELSVVNKIDETESLQNESLQTESVQNESVQIDSVQDESVQDDSVQSDSVQDILSDNTLNTEDTWSQFEFNQTRSKFYQVIEDIKKTDPSLKLESLASAKETIVKNHEVVLSFDDLLLNKKYHKNMILQIVHTLVHTNRVI